MGLMRSWVFKGSVLIMLTIIFGLILFTSVSVLVLLIVVFVGVAILICSILML